MTIFDVFGSSPEDFQYGWFLLQYAFLYATKHGHRIPVVEAADFDYEIRLL